MVAVMFVWMVLLCVVLGTRGADGGSQERPAALYNNCTLLERDVSCCGEGSCAVAMGGAWPLAGLLLLRDSVGSELSVWLDGRLVAKACTRMNDAWGWDVGRSVTEWPFVCSQVPPGEPWAPLPPLPAGRLEVGAEPPGCFRVSLFGCAGRDHSIGVGGTRSTGHAAVKRSAASATRQGEEDAHYRRVWTGVMALVRQQMPYSCLGTDTCKIEFPASWLEASLMCMHCLWVSVCCKAACEQQCIASMHTAAATDYGMNRCYVKLIELLRMALSCCHNP